MGLVLWHGKHDEMKSRVKLLISRHTGIDSGSDRGKKHSELCRVLVPVFPDTMRQTEMLEDIGFCDCIGQGSLNPAKII